MSVDWPPGGGPTCDQCGGPADDEDYDSEDDLCTCESCRRYNSRMQVLEDRYNDPRR